MHKHPVKQKVVGLILLLVLIVNVGVLIAPKPAYAQAPDVVAKLVEQDVRKGIAQQIKKALVIGATTALINLITYMANRFAYDAAVWVASGGNAENPLFDPRPPEDYLRYVGATIAAEVVDSIDVDNISGGVLEGFNLCAPIDPFFLGSLRVGIRSAYEQPTLDIPELGMCGVVDIFNNFEGYLISVNQTITDPKKRNEAILNSLSASFDPHASSFMVAMTIHNTTLNKAQQDAGSKFKEFIQNSGFQPLVASISGNVETPASMVQKEYYDATSQTRDVGYLIAEGFLSNTDALLSVGMMAGSVFSNTLLSEVINNIYEGAFKDITFDDTSPFEDEAVPVASRERAAERLKSLLSFTPLQVTDFNLLSEFTSCPTTIRGTSRGLFNCVMDTSFASAVARAQAGDTLTIQEAIDEDYLNGGWALIPSEDKARNQDSKCYLSAFCHGNLVKLRKARIISVGWEMAAESNASSATDPVTLQEVIDGFNDCNDEGELDDDHPWCHLIDSNWVLKFPQSQCRTLAFGQLLEASGTSNRAQECVDIQGCVAEDDQGNCTGGFGYCVREKNIWRFRGDQCPSQYASCLTFETRAGEEVDYLQNTLDFGLCNEGNAGCLWYATQKEEVDEVFDWPEITNVADADAKSTAYKNRVYFTAVTDACTADNAGCVELIEREEGLSLNLVVNSTFEFDLDENDWPDAWLTDDVSGATYDTENDEGRSGDAALRPGTSEVFQYGIELSQSQFYTLSFYAKQPSTTTANFIDVKVLLTGEDGTTPNLTGTTVRGDCEIDATNKNVLKISAATPTSTAYERFECTFTSPTFDDKSLAVLAELRFLSGRVWIDDIQLEQDEDASIWHVGYSEDQADLSLAFAKLPPSYLGCTGATDDPDECANYALICSANDQGCNRYTPTNGDPAVTAVTNELNQCPAICSGYDTYKQEPTLYEPKGDFPLYFIPDTAQECSAEDVGCDEFTNLTTEEREYFTFLRACVTEDQAAANTNRDNASVFYTWEGSDEEGFQLRVWDLIESDLGSGYDNYPYQDSSEIDSTPSTGPCTNWFADADGIHCDDDSNLDGLIDSDSADCDEHDDIFDNPNCREFYDTEGGIHYRDWSKTVTINDACVTYRKTELAGADATAQQDNCEGSGGYFVSDTNVCLYYGYNVESTTCDAAATGCREFTGGRSRNSRVALQELFEGGDLTSWGTDDATVVTLSNESIATDGHSIKSEGERFWTYFFDNGSACTDPDGCTSTTGNLGGSCTVAEGSQYCGTLHNNLFTGKTYTISFWAKGNGNIDVGFAFNAGASTAIDLAFEEDVALTDGWAQFSVGPLNMIEDDYPDFGAGSILVFDPKAGVEFFIDNVVIREGEQDITIIKNSWVTPAICDRTEEGVFSAQYHLGCQEYTDIDGDFVYLKSFARLCDESAVGCAGYFKTQQSDSAFAEIVNGTCNNVDADGDALPDIVTEKTGCYLFQDGVFDQTSTKLCEIITGQSSCQFDLDHGLPEIFLTLPVLNHVEFTPDTAFIPGDREVYAIVGSDDICSSSVAGCIEVAEPTFSPDHSVVETWESKYLLDAPDRYDDILCRSQELYCDAFDAGTRGTFYFQDPQDQVCEYKTDITIGGTKYDGWFREGTNNFCYGSGFCSGASGVACSLDSDCADLDVGECVIDTGSFVVAGEFSGIWRNGDPAYDNWIGLCTAEWNGCSEFRDPLDIDDNEFYSQVDGASYFFIDNENLDENTLRSGQRCDGEVSSKLGCALFNDTSQTAKRYNASATYIASAHADAIFGDQPFSLVNPISCDDGDVITTPAGEPIDLCAKRCVYRDSELSETSTISLVFSYSYGGSCYVDDDCPDMESDTGNLVEGSCVTKVPTALGFSTNVPRLEDDTNRVLKVARDRQCSEWLTCASAQTVWDESTASYRTICDSINLCTQYSATGDASFCSAWDTSDPAAILDLERYSSRDVSWYGEEFSGYAIPDIYPIQHLSQVNIAPPVGLCAMSDTDSELHGLECEDDTDCDDEKDACITKDEQEFRLAYNAGECDEDHAQDCTVGYCENSGAPCSSSAGCEEFEGECISGVCYDVSATTCTDDTDCAAVEICLAGTCVEEAGNCTLAFTCASTTSTCFPSTAMKLGACYRGSCVVAMDGNEFDEELSESALCRAHPETDSPFPNEVVEEWQVWEGGSFGSPRSVPPTPSESYDDSKGGALPFNVRANFENATLCAPGEECECSYKKLSATAGISAYIAADTTLSDAGIKGICSGGDVAGALCNDPLDCGDTSEGAKCDFLTRVDTILGLDGYCLEKDSGINVKGDPDQGACLTWFPVDQLAGSTDLYAKYTTAGFFGDRYYCGEVKTYVNLVSFMGCAPHRGPDGDDSDSGTTDSTEKNSNYCRKRVTCPDGYWAISGRARYGSAAEKQGSAANLCRKNKGGDSIWDRSTHACPYLCIPYNSFHDDGEPCGEPGKEGGATESATNTGRSVSRRYSEDPGTKYFHNSDFNTFDDWFENVYADCTYYGESKGEDELGAFEFDTSADTNDSDDHDYLTVTPHGDHYPACKSLIQVGAANIADYNVAWTDRLLNEDSTHTINAGIGTYSQDTKVPEYGKSITPSEVEELNAADIEDPTPAVIPSCLEDEFRVAYIPPTSVDSPTSCTSIYSAGFANDDDEPEAREFIEWTKSIGANVDTSDSKSDIADRLKTIFAIPIKIWEWATGYSTGKIGGDGLGSYPSGSTISTTDDFYWDVRDTGSPPKVWALDTSNCYGSFCREDSEGALTFNGKSSGDQEAEGGFLRASLKFFAAADKNQLPIRRVWIDWGDGTNSGSDDDANFYKNHRGLKDTSQTESICDDGNEWGKTPDSCDPNHFNYSHNYFCTTGKVAQLDSCERDADGNVLESPCTDDGASCTFQPRLHIRDNWGWCTGVCIQAGSPIDEDGTDDCFEGDGDSLTNPSDDDSECAFEEYPNVDFPEINPWVYYDGQIIVTP
ncbi:hypothetical protein IH979_00200 [Patescibacteria group bacterium]|nr:hypothetical protein [Patescibacteria group bacterium]